MADSIPIPSHMPPAQTGTDASAQAERMRGMSPDIEKMKKLLDIMLDKFGDVDKASESIGKKISGWEKDFKANVRYIEDIHDRSKALVSLQKQMTAGLGSAKDQEDAKKTIEALLKHTKDLEAHGVKSNEWARSLAEQYRAIGKAQKQVNSGTGNIASTMEELERHLVKTTREMDKLAASSKDIHLTGLRKDLAHADRALTSLFGKSSKMAKYHDIGKKGMEFKRDWKEKKDKRKDIHEENYADLKRSKSQVRYFKSLTPEKQAAYRERIINEKVNSRGGSKLTQFINRKAAEKEFDGGSPNRLLKIGKRLASTGEGSIMRGAASEGLGAVEGSASGVMALAAPLAAVLAGLEIVKELFDNNAKKNAEVHEKLSSGGILADGQNAVDSLHNTRNNLMGPAFGRLGVNYDKNLEIAKALNDSGIGISNLGKDYKGQGKDDRGMMKGSFGTLQRNVYEFGRAAGVDSNQTLVTTMKLLSSYSVSLHATEDFFVGVDHDSRAAGISVAKYIDLIEGIDESFSKMNRNLNDTVKVMKVLSINGRTTAEDLKNMVTGLTDGDKERPIAVKAFVAQQFMKNKGAVNQLGQTLDKNVSDQLDQVSSATGISKEELQKGIAKDGTKYLDNLGVNLKGTKADGSPLDKQVAGDAIRKLYTNVTQQQGFKSAMSKPGTAGALDLATLQDSMGNTRQGAIQNNLSAYEVALKANGLGLGSSDAAVYGNQGMQQTSRLMGLDMYKFGNAKHDIANIGAENSLDMAMMGDEKTDKDGSLGSQYKLDTMKTIREELEKRKLTTFDKNDKRSDTEKVKDYINANGGRTGKGGMDVTSIYETNDDLIRGTVGVGAQDRIGTKVDKVMTDAQLLKADQVSGATITVEDRMAHAFKYLFNKLQGPLDAIAKVVTMGGVSDTTPATSTDLSMTDKNFISGRFNDGRKGMATRIADDTKRAQRMKEGSPERTALEAQIAAEQKQLDDAGKAMDTRNAGKEITHGDALGISAISDMAGYKTPTTAVKPPKGVVGSYVDKKLKELKTTMAVVSDIGSVMAGNGGGTSTITNIVNNNVQATSNPPPDKAVNNSGESSSSTTITKGAN